MTFSSDLNIYIIGFMGAGKSTLARELATILDRDYVDLDILIETRNQTTIRQIFDTGGEEAFRRMETAALTEIARSDCQVVALGGGAFSCKNNRELCTTTGKVIWLDIPFKEAYKRVGDDPERPLFSDPAEARRLYLIRRQDYGQADFRVDVSERSPEELTGEILSVLELSGRLKDRSGPMKSSPVTLKGF